MRSLEDPALSGCCTTLIARIKELWIQYKYEEDTPICHFNPVDICVPLQSNNRDCGFHMLVHAEKWDGSSMDYFSEQDIPNIRKILLHKWVTHKDNQSDWKDKLGIKDKELKMIEASIRSMRSKQEFAA